MRLPTIVLAGTAAMALSLSLGGLLLVRQRFRLR